MNPLDGLKPVEPGHIDVHKHDIWFELMYPRDCLGTGTRGSGKPEILDATFQDKGVALYDGLFVVDDQDGIHRSLPVSILIRISVPSPGFELIAMIPGSSGKKKNNRWITFSSPMTFVSDS